jgi:hypothetical protein
MPHFELDDCISKEKNYKNLFKTNNPFDLKDSIFFKMVAGDNTHFECLGLAEPKIACYENIMLSKLNAASKHIVSSLPEEYFVEDLIVKINLNRG